MLRTYDEHRRCGPFVFGGREDVEATYPSLLSAARRPRRKRRDDAPPDGDGPDGEPPVDGDTDDEAPADEAPVDAPSA